MAHATIAKALDFFKPRENVDFECWRESSTASSPVVSPHCGTGPLPCQCNSGRGARGGWVAATQGVGHGFTEVAGDPHSVGQVWTFCRGIRGVVGFGGLEMSGEKHTPSDKQLLAAVEDAATEFGRCCDMYQDSMGGFHCTDCAQKTFVMLQSVQSILGRGKGIGATPLMDHKTAYAVAVRRGKSLDMLALIKERLEPPVVTVGPAWDERAAALIAKIEGGE